MNTEQITLEEAIDICSTIVSDLVEVQALERRLELDRDARRSHDMDTRSLNDSPNDLLRKVIKASVIRKKQEHIDNLQKEINRLT